MELPEEDELVLAVIKKILPYGAFCVLPEYQNREAFLHVSEVAPRWIKNIHEFISEGQRHVAKVYRLNTEKNQIDISLKRVSEEEKKKKLLVVRQDKRSEKWLEISLAPSKIVSAAQARKQLEEKFGGVYEAFQKASEDMHALDDIDLPQAVKDQIVAVAKKSIKKPTVQVRRWFNLVCYAEDGVFRVQKMLHRPETNLQMHYLGAPHYMMQLTAAGYKEGEKQADRILEDIKKVAEKNKCEMTVVEKA